MIQNFRSYFSFGLEHILTIEALDHILFVTALCLRYQFRDYRRILLLITAFTVGHCSTLILGTLNVVSLKTTFTEFFIALTIIITSASNLFLVGKVERRQLISTYAMAMLFGLIHGLGFAYGLRSILGTEENILVPLFAFNTGIELAQILVALIVVSVSWFFVTLLRLPQRYWVIFISGVIICFAAKMAVERFPYHFT